MRIAICDDERLHLLMIEMFVKKSFAKFVNIGSYTFKSFDDASKLLSEHRDNPFDAAFLDIDMPVFSGFHIADHLVKTKKDCKIIYVTSHAHLAADSFRHEVFDFLLKPKTKNGTTK